MKQKEWFETWFDSPYYHILYQHRDEQEAEQFIDNLLIHLQLSAKTFALDVACGKGRHAVYLAAKGLEVTGIDLSWKNIGHALHFESQNLSFFLHDMRTVFYINYFDVVFNLFTSFGYFETEQENMKAIHSMSLAMKKGGKLVIDFFNAAKISNELIPHEYVTRDGIMFLVEKKFVENAVLKRIYFQDMGRDFEFVEKVQSLRLADFERLFEKNQLKITAVFGDYHLNPFDEPNSNRMIIIGEKV
ncbi:MAG: class I SAM-dependent methyltransferase [Chitinophagaceae bacterium]|nr:class I SAM-dependent methyltransferase [Chitinophagaceae bacterium]